MKRVLVLLSLFIGTNGGHFRTHPAYGLPAVPSKLHLISPGIRQPHNPGPEVSQIKPSFIINVPEIDSIEGISQAYEINQGNHLSQGSGSLILGSSQNIAQPNLVSGLHLPEVSSNSFVSSGGNSQAFEINIQEGQSHGSAGSAFLGNSASHGYEINIHQNKDNLHQKLQESVSSGENIKSQHSSGQSFQENGAAVSKVHSGKSGNSQAYEINLHEGQFFGHSHGSGSSNLGSSQKAAAGTHQESASGSSNVHSGKGYEIHEGVSQNLVSGLELPEVSSQAFLSQGVSKGQSSGSGSKILGSSQNIGSHLPDSSFGAYEINIHESQGGNKIAAGLASGKKSQISKQIDDQQVKGNSQAFEINLHREQSSGQSQGSGSASSHNLASSNSQGYEINIHQNQAVGSHESQQQKIASGSSSASSGKGYEIHEGVSKNNIRQKNIVSGLQLPGDSSHKFSKVGVLQVSNAQSISKGNSQAFEINHHQGQSSGHSHGSGSLVLENSKNSASHLGNSQAYEIKIHQNQAAGTKNSLKSASGSSSAHSGKGYEIHEGISQNKIQQKVVSGLQLPVVSSQSFVSKGQSQSHGSGSVILGSSKNIANSNSGAYEINIHQNQASGKESQVQQTQQVKGNSQAFEINLHKGQSSGQSQGSGSAILGSSNSQGYEINIHQNQAVGSHGSSSVSSGKGYEIHERISQNKIQQKVVSGLQLPVVSSQSFVSKGQSQSHGSGSVILGSSKNIANSNSGAYEINIHQNQAIGKESQVQQTQHVKGNSQAFEINLHKGQSSGQSQGSGSAILGSSHSQGYEINIHQNQAVGSHGSSSVSSGKGYEIHEVASPLHDLIPGLQLPKDSSHSFANQIKNKDLISSEKAQGSGFLIIGSSQNLGSNLASSSSQAYEINIHQNQDNRHSLNSGKGYEIHEGVSQNSVQGSSHSKGNSQAYDINIQGGYSSGHSQGSGSHLGSSNSQAYEINIHQNQDSLHKAAVSKLYSPGKNQELPVAISQGPNSISYTVPVTDLGNINIQYNQVHFVPSVEEKDSPFVPIVGSGYSHAQNPSSVYGTPVSSKHF